MKKGHPLTNRCRSWRVRRECAQKMKEGFYYGTAKRTASLSQNLLLTDRLTPLPPLCFCSLYKLSYFLDNGWVPLSSDCLVGDPPDSLSGPQEQVPQASLLWMIFFTIKHCPVIHSFIHSPAMVYMLPACHVWCLELVIKQVIVRRHCLG